MQKSSIVEFDLLLNTSPTIFFFLQRMKDFTVDLEKRLESFQFHAKNPNVTWEKADIVNQVYDFEFQQRFTSIEDKLMFRIDIWVGLCELRNSRKKCSNTNTNVNTFPNKKRKFFTLQNIKPQKYEDIDIKTLIRSRSFDHKKKTTLNQFKKKLQYNTVALETEVDNNVTDADNKSSKSSKFLLFRKKK